MGPDEVTLSAQLDGDLKCLRMADMIDAMRKQTPQDELDGDVVELLYRVVRQFDSELAGKVTGMMAELGDAELRFCLFTLLPIEGAARICEWIELAKQVLDEASGPEGRG